ncbi:hypothetical protein K503DRAFT_855695 [Rhizopogon vinicolor AM-OR11-026]|uniref:Uncharacterized protein n=1 Tax=Rhizopogon vinicolor AM-OR11-026 TaxID=1314800 RepID=A0A1B7N4Z1_9AGAM|nr:hypothetical protein K503DRAFT_855695 [Rhizopogon vinicolor AM-OR11-026]
MTISSTAQRGLSNPYPAAASGFTIKYCLCLCTDPSISMVTICSEGEEKIRKSRLCQHKGLNNHRASNGPEMGKSVTRNSHLAEFPLVLGQKIIRVGMMWVATMMVIAALAFIVMLILNAGKWDGLADSLSRTSRHPLLNRSGSCFGTISLSLAKRPLDRGLRHSI